MSDSITSISTVPATIGADPMLQARFRALKSTDNATPEQLKKVAQDFEGVLIEKLMQEMKKTIPESEMFSGAGMEQIQDMFWSFLSEEVSQNGGIGLAQGLYRDLCRSAGVNPNEAAAVTPATRSLVGKFVQTETETNPRMERK